MSLLTAWDSMEMSPRTLKRCCKSETAKNLHLFLWMGLKLYRHQIVAFIPEQFGDHAGKCGFGRLLQGDDPSFSLLVFKSPAAAHSWWKEQPVPRCFLRGIIDWLA